MKRPSRSRIYAWWYFCIAAGFVLLSVNRWMLGERLWLVWLRIAIAGGFAVLGLMTMRGSRN